MSNYSNGIIDKWAEEASSDLGEKGWRDIDTNSMLLIIYSVQRARDAKIVKQVTKPIWGLLGILGAGLVWLAVSSIFSL